MLNSVNHYTSLDHDTAMNKVHIGHDTVLDYNIAVNHYSALDDICSDTELGLATELGNDNGPQWCTGYHTVIGHDTIMGHPVADPEGVHLNPTPCTLFLNIL